MAPSADERHDGSRKRRLGAPSSTQVAGIGDFDGVGKDDILWRNARTADTRCQIVGVGDFDGGAKSDILWRNSSTGENYLYLMNGTAIASEGYIRTVANTGWQLKGVADFNGDGKANIAWRNSSTGENYLYLMNGHQHRRRMSGQT